ncbi:hypothetical protein AAG906_035688 [Vitis piasezkii]
MVETSRDWSRSSLSRCGHIGLLFAPLQSHTILIDIWHGAVLPVEIEMGSLRVALEQQIPETDWAQARFDQLNLLDERRLRARTTFSAWLMDLDGNRFSEPTNVDQLKSGDPPQFITWEGSHVISTIYHTDNDLEILSLRRSSLCLFIIDIIFGVHLFMFRVHGSRVFLYIVHFIHKGMSFDHWVFEPSFLSFLLPYRPSLRYVPCLKTTLRPWDQMSSSTASAWTYSFQLFWDYRDHAFDEG